MGGSLGRLLATPTTRGSSEMSSSGKSTGGGSPEDPSPLGHETATKGGGASSSGPSVDTSKKRRKTKDLFLKRSRKFGGSGKKSEAVPLEAEGISEVPAEGPVTPAAVQGPCVCTLYRRTSDEEGGPSSSESSIVVTAGGSNSATVVVSSTVVPPTSGSVVPTMFSNSAIIDLTKFNPADYPIDDEDEKARVARAREMAEGIRLDDLTIRDSFPAHSQADFVHYLVPDLLEITGCSFYWGKIDRYEAERLLEGRPEGTFLLRDSAQEEYLFSVSFRRYGRSLHARIEQWNNHFSFDSHDPSVYSSKTVTGLIGHYKDPTCCMFFEPMLTTPLHRANVFPLLHLSRAAATKHLKYDDINALPLPKAMKNYLKEYHYKQRVCIRRLE